MKHLSLLLLLTLPAVAEPIGEPVSVEARPNGALVRCSDGSSIELFAMSPFVWRVHVARGPLVARPSVAVVGGPEKVPVEVSEGSVASRFTAVTVGPAGLSFSSGGEVFLEDFARPEFTEGGAFHVRKKLHLDEHFYGLGEKAARLDKRRGRFVMWNSDTPGYTEGTDPIYQSIPFYVGLRDGRAYGVLLDNSYKSWFEFGWNSQEEIRFGAAGGELVYYVIAGPEIKDVVERYTWLTGRPPLWPRWALGHQQCRWSYYPDSQVLDLAAEYDKRDLPLDVMHLDIHSMQDYRVFTWDRKWFPDPSGLASKLASRGLRMVAIVDPGVKYQPSSGSAAAGAQPELADASESYYVYDQGIEGEYFLKRRDGSLFTPKVWPGLSTFVDYSNFEARRWWGDLHRAYTDHGVAGIWNDMNEPADFTDQTGESHKDVVFEGGPMAEYRNLFALLMAQATFEGLQRLKPSRRPYVITRAAFAGIQRYSTMWTGDTPTTWEALELSIPMLCSLGLSGQSFVGGDIGGFTGRGDGELLVRWYQAAFLLPFCRNHKDLSGYDQEPWRFGKPYEDVIRSLLKLRYRMLPYLYACLEEAHRTGLPIVRPLVLEFPGDETTYTLDDQFLIGSSLMVAPVVQPGVEFRRVYLPQGVWYDYWTRERLEGPALIRAQAPLERVPLYVRGGTVLALAPESNRVPLEATDLELLVFPDASGAATGTVYEDDGDSVDYQSGAFRRTDLRVAGGRLVFTPSGPFSVGERRVRVGSQEFVDRGDQVTVTLD